MVISDGVLEAQGAGGAREALAERLAVERQQLAKPDDARLGEQPLLVGTEAGQVQQQRLVAPVVDVVGGGADLVRERLAPGPRLRDLQQQARGEHALALQALEQEQRHALELFDGRHGRQGPPERCERVARVLVALDDTRSG